MEFKQATNLEDAWYNFDPDLTLPMPEGEAFYIRREKSLARLTSDLLRVRKAKKYFVCGHKGSGKSTELNYLASNEDLKKRFKILDGVEFMLQHLMVLEYENDNLWLDVREPLLQFLEEKYPTTK